MKFTQRFAVQDKSKIFAECLCLVLAICYVDFRTGYDISLSVFYAIPVIGAVWYCGKVQGFILAIAGVVAWYVADHWAGHVYAYAWIGLWNGAVRLASLVLILFGMAAVKKQLQTSRAEVKSLQGILPICTGCKKIRDEAGYWSEITTYIAEHSQAHPTPKLCPECARRLYVERSKLTIKTD